MDALVCLSAAARRAHRGRSEEGHARQHRCTRCSACSCENVGTFLWKGDYIVKRVTRGSVADESGISVGRSADHPGLAGGHRQGLRDAAGGDQEEEGGVPGERHPDRQPTWRLTTSSEAAGEAALLPRLPVTALTSAACAASPRCPLVVDDLVEIDLRQEDPSPVERQEVLRRHRRAACASRNPGRRPGW